MEPLIVVIAVVVALLLGLAVGWFLGGKNVTAGAETVASLRLSLNGVTTERDEARLKLAQVETSLDERERSFDEQKAALGEAKELLSAQFGEIGQKLLGEAQAAFLQRADERFHQAGEKNEERLKHLLAPVGDRLKAYEDQVGKIEKERVEAYGNLQGLIGEMKAGQQQVREEAARLVNSLAQCAQGAGAVGRTATEKCARKLWAFRACRFCHRGQRFDRRWAAASGRHHQNPRWT